MRLLLTGASGFVGSTVLAHVLAHTDWDVACPVSYRHRGDGARINDVLNRFIDVRRRVDVIPHDLALPITPLLAEQIGSVDYVWNIASESHVDRSLTDPVSFVRNNVELQLNMLEYARLAKPRLFLHMSTDEVFGPAAEGYRHHEWDSIRPSNPYAASKAAQEALAYSYWRAMGIPLIVTNTMNLLAPAPQASEKFIPKIARAIYGGEKLTVHASPDGVSGSRCWVDARDFAAAWLWLTQHFDGDERLTYYPTMPAGPLRYNVVGEEASNLDVAERMAAAAGRPLSFELVDYHSQRAGHDHRYALDGSKLAELGWPGPRPLDETLADIVKWYADNPQWLAA
ncbi:NAD-dependent epimerase/dehydratase family protein [Streptomyces sp. 549]|uniref:NAD-dependent epimerase/dehydratase family protein n=1 Tax=Streptomyces sp. 549 TaxID=3049076 RepID=UPI0024C26140|nr:NAD-dependent epimerase/dehydratase family protein [Streptomyces sp. 549]MDK1473592.1 NAD-dependent epimerase/dehydratase family protein [Streptomyces sp. 549]